MTAKAILSALEQAAFWREISLAFLPKDIESYQSLFGPGGSCSPCESDHVRNVLGAKGGLLGDVAGFYEAFRFDPRREVEAPPDHAAAEASFCAWLWLKESYALHSGLSSEAAICRDAREKFLREHLRPLMAALAARLRALDADGPWTHAAELGRAGPCAPPSPTEEPS